MQASTPNTQRSVIVIPAKAYIRDKKIERIAYIPAYVNPNLEPEVLAHKDPRAQQVFDYVQKISEDADLNVRLCWDGEEVLVSAVS